MTTPTNIAALLLVSTMLSGRPPTFTATPPVDATMHREGAKLTKRTADVSSLLYRITRTVTTLTRYDDGTVERNRGIGFVAGPRFYTVHHNLESRRQSGIAGVTTLVDGLSVQPLFGDAGSDVAVFSIPVQGCAGCDSIEREPDWVVQPNTTVFWMWATEGGLVMREGRVVEFAWLGENPGAEAGQIASCTGNLVVIVDRAFRPGSSGSAVVDGEGRVLGVVQGSLIGHGEELGFFKPSHCLPGV